MQFPVVRSFAAVVVALVALAASAAESPTQRGAYLVRSIVACGNCHNSMGPNGPIPGGEFAGGLLIEDGGVRYFAPNITPDKATGIGRWTDAQIITAIREGRRPDGSIMGPPMPFGQYRHMSDRDVKAVVAYLRTVKPVSHKVERTRYPFPLPPAWGPPVDAVAEVPRADKVAYGRYLAGPLGHCVECHSPPGPQGAPDLENQLGAGGLKFTGPWGTSVSANLTPKGIGHYSDADLKKIITTGVRPDGSRLKPPMGVSFYARMKASDLDALVAYLRSLPPK